LVRLITWTVAASPCSAAGRDFTGGGSRDPMIELWVKALHIMAVISWMAGMFYLPRLFVYHVDAPAGSAQSQTFKLMERRLLRIIVTPAMIVVWATSGSPMPRDSFRIPGCTPNWRWFWR
jgi:uncharacterized membrane protein